METLSPEKLKELRMNVEKLRELNVKREKLFRELERSVAILEACPDAYEHGKCAMFIEGSERRPEKMQVIFKRGDGSLRGVPVDMIPLALLRDLFRALGAPDDFHMRDVTKYLAKRAEMEG